jgi:hypothetical protein
MKQVRDLGMTVVTAKSSVADEARQPTALVRRVVTSLRAEGLETDSDFLAVHVTSNGKILLTVGVREPQ